METEVIPVSILKHKFRQTLFEAVNSSGLQPCVIESVMFEVFSKVQDAAAKELQKDLAEYMEKHKNEK